MSPYTIPRARSARPGVEWRPWCAASGAPENVGAIDVMGRQATADRAAAPWGRRGFYGIFTPRLRYRCAMDRNLLAGYAWACGATAACTAIGLAMAPRF